MADHVIDRRADRLREAAIIERRRHGAMGIAKSNTRSSSVSVITPGTTCGVSISSAAAASCPAFRMPAKASAPCSLIRPSRPAVRLTSTFDIKRSGLKTSRVDPAATPYLEQIAGLAMRDAEGCLDSKGKAPARERKGLLIRQIGGANLTLLLRRGPRPQQQWRRASAPDRPSPASRSCRRVSASRRRWRCPRRRNWRSART